jgi:hypothetical protein
MSFSVKFIAASAADAERILAEEHLPESVRAFLTQAVRGCEKRVPGSAVQVDAAGHLCTGEDYVVSNATISVMPVGFRKPRELTPLDAG